MDSKDQAQSCTNKYCARDYSQLVRPFRSASAHHISRGRHLLASVHSLTFISLDLHPGGPSPYLAHYKPAVGY
jgi:hypothetical protein